MFNVSLKRSSLVFIAFSILAGSAFARHFNPLDSLTGNYLTIYLDTAAHPTLNGTPIVAGDEIGVFDSAGNCWGVGAWPGSGATTTFPVAGYNNVAGVAKPGMKPGMAMYFRVWDTASGEMPAMVTFFSAGNPVPFNANVTPYTDSAYENGNSALNPSVPSQITGLTVPGAPTPASPANAAAAQSLTVNLSWNSVGYATSYSLRVSTSAGFTSTVYYRTGNTATNATPGGLAVNGTYYWQVNATNFAGTGNWSAAWEFGAITQVTNTTTTGNAASNILGLAVSPKGYAAVGTNGTIYTSTNGTTWKAESSGTVASLNSIVYDEFVAVGNAGTILTSPDGVVWTPRSSNTANNLNGIDYNGSMFVAVGNSGTILTSPDGITWTVQQSGTTMNLVGVTYGEGMFAVVGNSGTILTSADSGAMWTAQSSGVPTTNLSSIAFGGTQFVAVGNGGTILSSPNGSSWTSQTSGTSQNLSSVAYSSGQFAAVGANSVLLTSTNGTNWTGGSTGSGTTLNTILIAGNQIIGCGNSGTVINAVTTDVPSLSAPGNFSSNLSISSMNLSWGAVNGALSYNVMVATNASFSTTVLSVNGLTATQQATGPLSWGTTYYWQVGAQYSGYAGAWSCVWTFTTLQPPTSPALSTPANGAVGQALSLSLTWGPVANAATYGVMVSMSSTFGTTVYSQTGLTAPSAAVGGLACYSTCYWKVAASNAAGTSPWSVVSSFTTASHLAVPLSNGYNLYSLNVHPADSSTTGIFKGLKGFLLAEDAYTNTWWPLGGVTTELDTLTTGSGYWIFDTSSTDTLKLTGAADVATTPISLLGLSYDLVAYLPQVNLPFETALASLLSPADTQLIIAEDGAGENIYWPAGGLYPAVDSMYVGTGYVMVTKANATLTYPAAGSNPAKLLAAVSGKPHMSRPPLRHYAKHSITGNSEILLSRQVEIGGKAASGNCEVGAFDTKGNLVGAGSVVNGVTAFNIWGQDPLTRAKDGCAPSEKIGFRLWDGSKEYPLAVAGGNPVYAAKTILSATLAVPEGVFISSFNLSRAYPNPFRGSVSIAFDVPTIAGVSQHAVEIDIYDVAGSLVKQLAKGIYRAGHYSLAWNCGEASVGSNVYIVRMKAANFDKRLTLVRVRS
jgi:hypothetical protein